MRTKYSTILYDLRPGAKTRKYEYTDSEIKNKGREFDHNKNHFGYNGFEGVVAHYNISQEISQSAKPIKHPRISFSGNFTYVCPELDVALQFAEEMGDRILAKAIRRLQKYDKEAYESFYAAYNTAYNMYKSDERASKAVEERQNEIYKLEHKKVDKELSDRVRNKRIIAKNEEIDEIVSRGKKRDKKYARKYVKFIRKANYVTYTDKVRNDSYHKAQRIVSALVHRGVVKYKNYEGESYRKTLAKFEYTIDEGLKQQVFSELREKLYTNAETKSR